jgi:predicted phosphodiesterase
MADDVGVEQTLEVSRYSTEVKMARAQVKELSKQVVSLEKQVNILSNLAGRKANPPHWLTKPRKKIDTGTVCTILSDTHFDEVVNPSEIGGRNAYNRKIAVARLERYFQKVILLTKEYITGLNYNGVVLFLGGDIFSGDIHEELTESNEDTMLGSVLFWTEQLCAGITLLADEFGSVHVPCVVGNHGRRTRKPRAKMRARDNFDWFLAKNLETQLASDKRITFEIPDATDVLVTVNTTRYLLTHGDQTSGGGGISGIWPSLVRFVARKQVNTDFDCMVLGHFHQLVMAPTSKFMLNGSLKGWDEYSAVQNYPHEIAQQALWIDVPDKGILWQTAIHVADPKAEGWLT